MAVSDAVKTDLLLKKLYGVSKTDTATNKSPSNEAISSPLLIRGDTIWTQANSIPATAVELTGVVQGYLTTNRIQCVPDTTTQQVSGIYPTWLTNLTDWIPTEFDTVNLNNTYRVKVYYGAAGLSDPAASGGTQIFADGSGNTGEWFFDYQSGVLNFLGGTPPAGMIGSQVIYIYGYRYVGSTSVNTLQPPNDSNFSITTTGNGIVEITTSKLNVNSTNSIKIPVGTTEQRDSDPQVGQIRYNSELSTFEGFGPGDNWGSLGGVKDVDQDTYILAELTPANDDDTLTFVNGGTETLTITSTAFDLKNTVAVTINNTTNSSSSTTGALVVAGGVGIANDIIGSGWSTSSIQQFEIDEGEY